MASTPLRHAKHLRNQHWRHEDIRKITIRVVMIISVLSWSTLALLYNVCFPSALYRLLPIYCVPFITHLLCTVYCPLALYRLLSTHCVLFTVHLPYTVYCLPALYRLLPIQCVSFIIHPPTLNIKKNDKLHPLYIYICV